MAVPGPSAQVRDMAGAIIRHLIANRGLYVRRLDVQDRALGKRGSYPLFGPHSVLNAWDWLIEEGWVEKLPGKPSYRVTDAGVAYYESLPETFRGDAA